ncbi:MAG: alpha-E domain-containing protein [Acidimicrobiales bacterium]
MALSHRNIHFSLRTAEECLAELDPISGRLGPSDEGRRVLGRLRTTLEFIQVSELLFELPRLLPDLQRQCAAASMAIASRYFRKTNVVEWIMEREGVEGVTTR